MPQLIVAFCTYNRAERLGHLVTELRRQRCPVPFEILAVDNNSSDETFEVLLQLASQPEIPLRAVHEPAQGIIAARNRAIAESMQSEVLVFIDDDETPQPGMLGAAYDAIVTDGAECVGGRIDIDFGPTGRPGWLDAELAAFIGYLDHGAHSFWITDLSTPVWSGNVAYKTSLFREDKTLRFDPRYSRKGIGVGGGEDKKLLRDLLDRGVRIRYRPDMAIRHHVEPWKLRRSYFIRLRYRAGVQFGLYELPVLDRTVIGLPPFLVRRFFDEALRAFRAVCAGRRQGLRATMSAAHALGTLVGYRSRHTAGARRS